MFHFPAYPPAKPVPAHDGWRVPPFGNPRIKALSAAPRGLSRPHTSFIGPVCQGIHHTPLQATRPASNDTMPDDKSSTTSDHKTIANEHQNKFGVRTKSTTRHTPHRHVLARVHSPVLKPPPHPRKPAHAKPITQTGPRGAGHPHQAKHPAWRPGNPRTRPYHPHTPTTGTQASRIRSLPHQQPPARPGASRPQGAKQRLPNRSLKSP